MIVRAKLWLLLGAGVVAASVTGGWVARAAIDGDRTWGTIPYRGHLEVDGAARDVPVDLRFTLWDAATDGNELWGETQASVPVAAGEFSVRLGSVTGLNAAVETAQDLYLAVAVKAPTDSAFVTLVGRQALGAVPFALAARRSVPGHAFVADGLTVSGDATLTGTATATSIAAQTAAVTGAVTAASVTVSGDVTSTNLRTTGEVRGANGRADCGAPTMDFSNCRSSYYVGPFTACDFRICDACSCGPWNPGNGTQIIRATPGY